MIENSRLLSDDECVIAMIGGEERRWMKGCEKRNETKLVGLIIR